jgi:hypothetical protein
MQRAIIYICISLITAIFQTTNLHGQGNSALIFSNTTYDYGHIKEDGGAQQCTFEARNNGHNTIEVINVTTTCGCTSTQFNRGPIAPGESFTLQISFNPMNRPGRIDKQIFVSTSDSSQAIELNIAGFVLERERSIDELYPFDMGGGLRLRSNFHAFGYLEHGNEIEEHIAYINTSDEEINISIISDKQSGALAIRVPESIPPGATGDIIMSYTLPEQCDIYGTLSDILHLEINGVKSNYPLSAEAIATDNFDMMDDILAPRTDISENIIKFGDVNSSKEFYTKRITLSNSGESPLIIRSIESMSEAIECTVIGEHTITPGQQSEIEVRLYVNRIQEDEYPFTTRIRLVTNDPMRPLRSIKVNALPN